MQWEAGEFQGPGHAEPFPYMVYVWARVPMHPRRHAARMGVYLILLTFLVYKVVLGGL